MAIYFGINFDNVKGITIPVGASNKAVTKITNSAGTIVWQKPYTWKKYESVYRYSLRWISGYDKNFHSYDDYLTAYSNCSINSSTGDISVSGTSVDKQAVDFYINKRYEDYPYVDWGSGEIWKITGVDWSPETDTRTTIQYSLGSASGAYARGTYIEDVIGSASNTYPVNGRHTDGYWYVRQA